MGDGNRSQVLVTGGSGFIGRQAPGTNVEATAGLLEQARTNEVAMLPLAATNAVTGDVGRVTSTAQATGPMILGAGESVSVNDILDAARSVKGSELLVTHVPARPGEMPAVIADISRARSIGYEAEQDLKSGRTTGWPEFAEATQ